MNRQVEKISHRGETIYFSDYSKLRGPEFTDVVWEHYRQHARIIEAGGRQLRFLTDVTDTIADRETVQVLKETARRNAMHTHKSAVVGVTGMQKILLRAVNLFSSIDNRLFETREQALDWLAE